MKSKIRLRTGRLSQSLDRFERTWERTAKAGARGAEVRLTFESLPLLLKNLTPARWALLEDLKRHGQKKSLSFTPGASLPVGSLPNGTPGPIAGQWVWWRREEFHGALLFVPCARDSPFPLTRVR